MRGSDPNASLYWLARLMEGGEDPMYIARRMVIFASEDVGNADVRGLPLAVSALQATKLIGMPEARLILGQCCTFLATAPKSNAVTKAIGAATKHVRQMGAQPVPIHIANAAQGYRYPHDYPHHVVKQDYWPENVPATTYYQPTAQGDEKTIGKRLAWWEARKIDPDTER